MTSAGTSPSSPNQWEPPSPEALQAMLPQYEISAIIGRGGMGAVYRGRQTKLDRDVAIKLLPESLGEDADGMNFTARFEQEAKAMAKLDHPAIISVFDFGETSEGQLYIVMEFVEGMDIHQYLQHHGGKLIQEDALAIIAHVLDALDYAHSQGIVHRDIKPANILLNNAGRVKVADFGLAKTLSSGEGEEAMPALTMSNVALGTPDFVAPEALDCDQVPDHRADLYAIGVMLYQMLTGKLPRGQFKLPSQLVPDLDPRLDEIVNLSLQADPNERYASASAIRSALDPIFTTPITKVEGGAADPESAGVRIVEEVSVAVATPVMKSKAPLWIGVAVAVLAIGGVAAFLMKGGSEPETSMTLVEEPVIKKAPAKPEAKPEPKQEVPEVSKPKKAKPEVAMPTPDAKPDPVQAKKPASEVAAKETTQAKPEPLEPKPEAPTSAAKEELPNQLAAVPGLENRLTAYLNARRTQVNTLASGYLRGLDGRLNQAADVGDLLLVKAFRTEKTTVATLQQSLAEKPSDLIAAVEDVATLPDLSADAPEGLQTLRSTWITERQKIRDDLDGKLQQSLQSLQTQLTKAREFDHAEAVMAFRTSLEVATPVVPMAALAAVENEETIETAPPGDASTGDRPIQGRLKAFGNFADGKPMDLSAAEGITDFIEVYCTSRYFVALRANGEVVSNSPTIPASHPARIKKIFDGLQNIPDTRYFRGLTERGDLISLNAPGDLVADQPTLDSPVVDVIAEYKGHLALLVDGTIRWWGNKYKEQDGGKAKAPPEEARTGVKAIAASSNFGPGAVWAAVLTEQGKVIAWTPEGEWELPGEFNRGVAMISNQSSKLIALDQRGEVFGIGTGNEDQIPKNHRDIVELRASGGGEAFVIRDEDGKWQLADLGTNGHPLIEEGLSHLSNQGPRQFDVAASGGANIDGVVWIEPVEPSEEPMVPEPEVASPKTMDAPAASSDPIQGRLKAFGNFVGNKPMELSAAEGITDFIEVYCTSQYFVALRANGEVVSNSGSIRVVKPARIKRIFQGMQFAKNTNGFMGLTELGDLISLEANSNLADLPKMDSPVVDVIVRNGKLLTLLEDGTLRWWGRVYEAQGGKAKAPPEEARTGIKAIAASSNFGPGGQWSAALTEQGEVILWANEGARELPNQFRRDVVMISNVGGSLKALNQRGEVFSIGKNSHRDIVELRASGGGDAFVMRDEDGTWRLDDTDSRFPLIAEGLSQLSNQGPRQFDVAALSKDSIDGIVWIEPVDPGSAPTSPPEASTPETSSPKPAEAKKPATSPPAVGRVTSKVTKGFPFVNSLEMKFVPVPITGGPTDGHKVLFSVWETRVSDFLEFVDETELTGWPKDQEIEKGLNAPVGYVSQLEAIDFCEWLTRKERGAGLIGPNERYRLPSDHEWSCAVGIGQLEDALRSPAEKNRVVGGFPWGGTWPPGEGDGSYKGIGEAEGYTNEAPIPGYRDGFKDTAPVGSFRENEYGLFDLGGNLLEWCTEKIEVKGVPSIPLRGGSFESSISPRIKSSSRRFFESKHKAFSVGFRCVLVTE